MVDIDINRKELLVASNSAKGPFFITLPQEAALVLIDEGKITINTNRKDEESKAITFKVQDAHARTKQQDTGNKFRSAAGYRSAKNEIPIIYNLWADHPTGLIENGVHDELIDQIKKALIEVFGNPEGRWDYVFDQPESGEFGVRRHAIRVFIKYNDGPNCPEPQPADMNFMKLKFISRGERKFPLGSLNEEWRTKMDISSCCFRQDCKYNNFRDCPFKREEFERLQVPPNLSASRRVIPTPEMQEKKRAREENRKMAWLNMKTISEERIAQENNKLCKDYVAGKVSKASTTGDQPNRLIHDMLRAVPHKGLQEWESTKVVRTQRNISTALLG